MIQNNTKTTFICASCSAVFPKWRGQCTCKKWNTIEEVEVAAKKYSIPKVSEKRKAQIEADKNNPDNDKVLKEKWFTEVRTMLTGICACGCGQPSEKKSDEHFRGSCCHIFPKAKFKSVRYNLFNFVERSVFDGCHSQLDDRSIDKWVGMADWENIKRRFLILSTQLTAAEKATKFYTQLEKLVNEN